jgi:hypothetical protein
MGYQKYRAPFTDVILVLVMINLVIKFFRKHRLQHDFEIEFLLVIIKKKDDPPTDATEETS